MTINRRTTAGDVDAHSERVDRHQRAMLVEQRLAVPHWSRNDVYDTVMSQALTPLADKALFVDPSGELQLDVQVDSETVWLSQQQLADLFDVSRQNINFHMANIYAEGELPSGATRKESLQVRIEGKRTVRRKIDIYSLDAILSVGYRVNSKTATAFRQWATRTLRERLIAVHRQRQQMGWQDLSQIASHVEDREEATALLRVIDRYAKSWRMLQLYDENRLPAEPSEPTRRRKRLTLRQARAAIAGLRTDQISKGFASDIFGVENKEKLEAVLGNIEQTFGGQPLYPSTEERAAALLYFIIKDHVFVDGNKRIGSLLFVHYLDKNGALARPDGQQRFDENALVATALLVAASDPKQKDLVMRLVLAMLSDRRDQDGHGGIGRDSP